MSEGGDLDAMADESQTKRSNPTPPAAVTFDAFVNAHLAVLLRVAGSLCGNTPDAEDLIHPVCLGMTHLRKARAGARGTGPLSSRAERI
jgi:DNA-directed RNA polymerase specialized sigma24 family protein